MVPLELFGTTAFPPIGDQPYLLTLGPHSFYWFQLEASPEPAAARADGADLPALTLRGRWPDALNARTRSGLEALLPAYLQRQRWFGGKGRRIRSVAVQEAVPVPMERAQAALVLAQVHYSEGSEETYQLALAFAPDERAQAVLQAAPQAGLARLTVTGNRSTQGGLLYDALADEHFCRALLALVIRRRRLRGPRSTVAGLSGRELRGLDPDDEALAPRPQTGEQSNNSIVFGEQALMKVYRRIEEGDNPELEIGRHLTQAHGFSHAPAVLGHVALRAERRPDSTMAVVHRFTPNQGDAWGMTLDELSLFFERVAELGPRALERPELPASLPVEEGVRPAEPALIGPYLELARLLGQRTAEMHLALADGGEDPAFAPEPFSTLYQRSLSQSLRAEAKQSLGLLQRQSRRLDKPTAALAQRVLSHEGAINRRLHAIAGAKLDAVRTRIHGDYHLGQVLYTGRDFLIIDFEGEPARPIGERRIKRSPLRDVAGMMRSFDYAVRTALHTVRERRDLLDEYTAAMENWGSYWQRWSAAMYLQAYRSTVGGSALVPSAAEKLALLLDVHLLDKALYELTYELNNRPDWVSAPLRGLLAMLEPEA